MSKGVHIALEKRMPVGAGLGGGSSDAAAILRHMPVFWDVLCDEAIQTSIAQSLGADVPICLNPEGLWLMEGIGHDIQPLSRQLADAALLLVHPRVPTSTPAVYKAFANVGELSSPECVTDWLAIEDAWAWRAIAGSNNDLQRPAITVSRTIAEVLQELMTALPEPECARMSGSGACCFALYKEKSQADNLASSLRQQHPDWWVAVTNLR